MRWFRKIEARLAPHAVPYVTQGLIIGQALFMVLAWSRPDLLARMPLASGPLLHGEWWRAVTFVFIPPDTNLLWAGFAWYIFWLMGVSLEQFWGTFRYNVYLLVAWVATVAVSLLTPMPIDNMFIGISVFLAFAWLYPEVEFALFFVLPVKVKYLAGLAWLFIVWAVIAGGRAERLAAAAAVLNFLIFFGPQIVARLRTGRRRAARAVQKRAEARSADPFHRCTVCGITDRTHPHEDFRYCPDCDGSPGYCSRHIHHHEHVRTTQESARK